MAKNDYHVHVRPSVRVSVCLSVCVSVHMEQLGSHWADFHEIWYWSIVSKNPTRITHFWHEDWCTFMILARCIHLRMRSGRENQNTHFIFSTFCWPCISVYLSQYLTKLIHKIYFTISFISCLYMFRAHVLIIRRSKLPYTASGIITPIGGLRPTATYMCDDTRCCIIQFWPPDDEHICSKHVEAWNRTYCETNFVHQVG